VGSSLKSSREIFLPHLEKVWRGKTSNFAELSLTRRQSEARNFETAQHIDKQKQELSNS